MKVRSDSVTNLVTVRSVPKVRSGKGTKCPTSEVEDILSNAVIETLAVATNLLYASNSL